MNKIIFITGTPGVGKTTIATSFNEFLSENYETLFIKISDFVINNNLIQGKEPKKNYNIVNIDKLNNKLNETINSFFIKRNNEPNESLNKIAIVEGHLSHLCEGCEKVIVLRLNPKLLEKRLKSRNYPLSKIKENLESEAIDVCSLEAYEKHGKSVNEVDTSNLNIEDIMNVLKEIVFHDIDYPVGKVDFSSWILESL